jgi:hypothetical protein
MSRRKRPDPNPERDDESEKKERVIHTRVPEHLDETIRRRAHGLGLSVSNLVRNVLSNTFGLVEGVVTDSANVARSARGEALLPTAVDGAGPPLVLGWQEALLNLNALCARCNAILPKGTRAAIALTDRPGPRPFLCLACLAALGTPPPDQGDAP